MSLWGYDALDDVTVSACLPQVSQVTAVEMASQSTSQPCHLHLPLHPPSPKLSALLGGFSNTPGDITAPASAPGNLGSFQRSDFKIHLPATMSLLASSVSRNRSSLPANLPEPFPFACLSSPLCSAVVSAGQAATCSPRGLQSPGGTARVVGGQPWTARAPQEGRQVCEEGS